jgi:hypothetical protein
MIQGINTSTGEDICPSTSQIADAKKACATANNYKQCMKRLLGDYYEEFICTAR